jgi:formylglycine-generating enzyme required for sulfatase activity
MFPRRAIALALPLTIVVSGSRVVADNNASPPPARAYQCGKGTPNLAERRCSCPTGTSESRTERGLSRCVDDSVNNNTTKNAPLPSCPPEMAAILGGTYTLGSRGDTVTIAPFCLDKTEVTVAAFERCVVAGTCSAPKPYDVASAWKWQALCNYKHPEGRALHPVNCVKWMQASTYCGFVKARLPTEDEWEWAARNAGDATDYPWGTTSPTPENANACGSECPSNMKAKVGDKNIGAAPTLYTTQDGFAETAPVGSFLKGDSKSGVHDLAGNVAEWTTSGAQGAQGTGATANHSERIARGGSWRSGDQALLAMSRVGFLSESAFPAVGFRCVKSP